MQKHFHIPVIAIGGSVSLNYSAVHEKGIDAVFSITTSPMTLEEAYKVAEENIEMTAKNIASSVENSIRKTLLNAGVFFYYYLIIMMVVVSLC